MTIFVHWKEMFTTEESSFNVSVDAGILIVHYVENVLTKTEWAFGEAKHDASINNRLCLQVQHYLNNPKNNLTVDLKKQGTDFRIKVWTEICKIPAGRVISYTELANKIGSGARAVANACRDNPFPGIVPCHRVVAVNGLGGYMGETKGKFLDIKKKLLRVEAELR